MSHLSESNAITADDKAELWRILDRARGTLDVAALRKLLLTLVYLRAVDEDSWSESLVSPDPDESLRTIRHPPQIDTHATLSSLQDLPRSGLHAIIEYIDRLAKKYGNPGTFRFLLEGFAGRDGLRGGDFYTPTSVTEILSRLISAEPTSTIYDPACRSGELLVAAASYARKKPRTLAPSIHGAALNGDSLTIAQMNAHLNNIASDFILQPVGDFLNIFTATPRFSYILSNPPFNMRGLEDYDRRTWRYGRPPKSNANFAWLQLILERLAPAGRAAVLMPNGALSSASPRELNIRKGMVEDGCIEALISLPSGLFHNTGIPVTIWLLRPPDLARDEVLLIDASNTGYMIDRTRREIGDAAINEISKAVDNWRAGLPVESSSTNIYAASLAEIQTKSYNLNPLAYSRISPVETGIDIGESSVKRMIRLLETCHDNASEKDAAASLALKGLKW